MERNVSIGTDAENPTAEKNGRKDGERSKSMCSRGFTLIKEICKLEGGCLTIWNRIFVTSCVFAVYLDPFFFYVVIIDQNNKCFQMDKTLSIVAFLLRSLMDFVFLVHLICEICYGVQIRTVSNTNTLKNQPSAAVGQTRGNSYKKLKIRKWIAQKMPWLSVFTVTDFLALIPLPQLLMVVMFYNMKGSRFVENLSFLNFFLLCQYFPRIYRVYLSAKDFKRTNGIWAKGLYNLILYILASHVLGAFWYLFSIERELTCWHRACGNHRKDHRECLDTFHCNSRSTARNITFLNEHCPLDTKEGASSLFNFGIFLDSLKNQNTEHEKFGKKFFYSFWWGLRNLSNFGTNLTTSTYVYENLFVVFLSVIGLLLFTYLIGNMQTFMQMQATKTEEMRAMGRRFKGKKQKVKEWMDRNELPNDLQEEILSSIKNEMKQHIDADIHNSLFYILPETTTTSLKRCLCKKIKKLQDMDDHQFTSICDHLQPVMHSKNSFVFRMGEPLDYMLFIIEGTLWTYASSDSEAGQGISSMTIKPLGKGDFYGEELLDYASDNFIELPISSKHVKSQTKVEAFVLMAKDLETVVSRHKP